MRRLVSIVLAGSMLLVVAGTVSAAKPVRTASFWACTNSRGVQAHVEWDNLHPDTVDGMFWVGDAANALASPVGRPVEWKFGNTAYEYAWAAFGALDATGVDVATTFAARLYSRGKLLMETNAVAFGDMPAC